MKTSAPGQRFPPSLRAGIVKRLNQVAFTLVLQAALLFLSSGRLDWVWAWVFLGLYLAGLCVNVVMMLRYNPEAIAERAKTRGMRGWDKIVAGLGAAMYFVALLVVAGLDTRFGWTGPLAPRCHFAGAAAFLAGSGLFSWAMVSNAYFATIVRIQEDRGHTVCTAGPYRHVRHPGYAGMIVQSLALPLMLGSLWSAVPGGAAALLMVLRTALEDRTLAVELGGYAEYARRVRYRLLPGVW